VNQSKKKGSVFYGIATVIVLIIITLLVFIPFLIISVLKIYPNASWRTFCTKKLHKLATLWMDFNNYYLHRTNPFKLEVTGLANIHPANWHLIVTNHQSWLDIVMLEYLFNRINRIPLLTFFIKNQLKWVPLLGFCWWAMGFPFMKRHSKEYLAKNPHKKGQDLHATLKAIEHFKKIPASIVSFVEGTRCTPEKSRQQGSPYQHLLKPKAGGISFVIGGMYKEIDSLLDVTIVYPDEHHSLWDFLCHRMTTIKIQIRRIPIPAAFRTPSLLEDQTLQALFRNWLNEQWLEKDQLISLMKT